MPIVIVKANRPVNRVDRQAYDVRTDAGASNGSAADVLNNVPSVAVGADGTVTLRGNGNVQVYIDGKRSAMMQGEHRAAALAALPAGAIESVEVIHNPGAQFGSDGGGGPIINLVLRRTRDASGFGAATINSGTGGRHDATLSGTYHMGALSFQGSAQVRHDERDALTATDRLRIDPASGKTSRSTQDSHFEESGESAGVNGSFTYKLDDNDTFGAGIDLTSRGIDHEAADRYVNFAGTGLAERDYVRTTRREGATEGLAWHARFEHRGDTRGEVGRVNLRISSASDDSDSAFENLFAIGSSNGQPLRSHQYNLSNTRIVDLSGDYELPGKDGTFKAGCKAVSEHNLIDTRLDDVDPQTGITRPNAHRSNSFALQTLNIALYGAYEMRLNGDWGLQGGLRAEQTHVDIDQLTSEVEASNEYFNLIPSVFASYSATDDTDVRLTYAHRIGRPGANDLNPFVIYRDEFNVASGNPDLEPTRSDAIELALESKFGAIESNLRGYYRKESGIVAEHKKFISDAVVLTTRDNVGSSEARGLELSLRGKLMPQLSFDASGNMAYTEQRAGSNAPANPGRSTPSLSAQIRLNYQHAQWGQLQLALHAHGKTPVGLGYRKTGTTGNLHYRLPLSATLTLVVSVNDLLDSSRIETSTVTDRIDETIVSRPNGRIAFLGLAYRFGGPGAPPKGS